MPTQRTFLFVVLWVLAAGIATHPAHAEESLSPSCVSREATLRLAECPAGLKKRIAGAQHKPAFEGKPPQRRRKIERTVGEPKNPDLDLVEEFRHQHAAKTAEIRLLIVTVQQLEGLLSRTPKNSPDRVDIVRRTAEEYVNLRKQARQRRLYAEAALRVAKKKGDQDAADRARSTVRRMSLLETSARKGAIQHYARLKREYPKYPKLDEVLYYLAFELEQGGEQQEARKVYFELIQKAPQSPYVPNAYLAFGELFFVEAQADPSKWDLAAQAYQQVIKYPAPGNKVLGFARYKLAYVRWNQEDYSLAISEMKRVIEFGNQHPGLPGAQQLVRAARRDLVPLYAASGRPERAYAFFQPLSGDSSGKDRNTLDMLGELGLAYLDTGHYADGIAVFEELKRRDHGARWCGYQTRITEAVQALHSGNKPRIVAELDRQLAAMNEFAKRSDDQGAKRECRNDTVALVAETAMSWHLEAVGSGGVRGTGDEETMHLAAELYDRVIERFDADEFARFEFPRIVKADWPTLYKIKYARADLCYFAKDWDCAAKAFTQAVEQNPGAPDAPEAAYAAALAFQHIFDREHTSTAVREGTGESSDATWDRLQPKELTDPQRDMIGAFDRYLCVVDPDESPAIAEQYSEIEYARARLYFEAQHWEEAAAAFRQIALERPQHDSAIYAAQLSLESLNVLRSHAVPAREACVLDIGTDVQAYAKAFCANANDDVVRDQCAIFTRISCDVDRLRAEELVRRADSGRSKEPLDLYQEAGAIYLSTWRQHGEKQLAQGKPAACENMDEVLSNMARAYQAAHLLAKAMQARRILVDPRYGLYKTQLATQALYDLGQNHQAIAMYDEASTYFERYAAATSYRGENAAEALSDAVVLRLGLGQVEPALEDARTYERHLGRRHPDRAARIAFAIAAHHGERGAWRVAQEQLRRSLRLIDASSELDVKTEAHALLGQAYLELGQRTQAARQYSIVRKLWADPQAATEAILRSKGSKAERQRRLGRSLTALGEATYFVAEEQRSAVERIRFPSYHGPGSIAEVNRHVQTQVKAWIDRKKPLLEAATQSYTKVLQIEPHAPPSWVIASGAQVGAMWSRFVTEFRAAPIPDSILGDDRLRSEYYEALDRASEPYKQLARQAYEKCLDYSVKYQYFDEHSRSCEVWLATNYKTDYHLLDEFRAAPDRANSASREHPPALRIGGEPLRAGR